MSFIIITIIAIAYSIRLAYRYPHSRKILLLPWLSAICFWISFILWLVGSRLKVLEVRNSVPVPGNHVLQS
jgi:hypothetical protein